MSAAARAFLAGQDLPLPEAWRARPPAPMREPQLPDESFTKDEAAATRAAIMGSPVRGDEGKPSTEREAPLDYGPTVTRLVVGNDGSEAEVRDRLSAIHRDFPDQMEARRRARTGVPLMGWPPSRMFAKDA